MNSKNCRRNEEELIRLFAQRLACWFKMNYPELEENTSTHTYLLFCVQYSSLYLESASEIGECFSLSFPNREILIPASVLAKTSNNEW